MVSMFAAIAAVSAFAEPMLTEWGAKVTSANALREYPRPQLERSNWTCLNGDWDYAVTPVVNAPVRPDKWDGKIRVPFALESPLSGCNGRLLNPQEYLWYAPRSSSIRSRANASSSTSGRSTFGRWCFSGTMRSPRRRMTAGSFRSSWT